MNIREFFMGTEEEKAAQAEVEDLGSRKVLPSRKRIKLEKAQQTARGITRRRALTLIGAAFAAGATGIGLLSTGEEDAKTSKSQNSGISRPNIVSTSGVKATKIPSVSAPSHEDFDGIQDWQKQWKDITISAVEQFRDADPEVATLLDFMKERALYPIARGPKTTQFVFDANTDERTVDELMKKGFEIVFMPEEYATQMPSAILTEPGGRTVRVATSFKSKEWLAIILTHELSHVYDQMINGENSHNTNEYLEGEVKAHLLEMKLLRAWDPEIYDKFIRESDLLLSRKDYRGVINLAHSYYPLDSASVSDNETALGTASCMTASVFEYARKRGASDEDLKEVYMKLKQMFGRGKTN